MFILIRFLFISALIIILSDCTIALFNTFVIEREKIFSFTKTSSSLIHMTYVPFISSASELKTKPTQHSVKELLNAGIQPDIIMLSLIHI